jgi:type III secretory pathway component EscV
MITLIVTFFKAIIAVITKVFAFIAAHPRLFFEVLAACAIAYGVFHFTKAHTEASVWESANKIIKAQNAEIDKANADARARDAKIERIEKESKDNAASLTKQIEKSKADSLKIVSDYEKKLEAERKKLPKASVENPVTKDKIDVDFNPKGDVVCRTFPDAFTDTMNELVENANRVLLPRIGEPK